MLSCAIALEPWLAKSAEEVPIYGTEEELLWVKGASPAQMSSMKLSQSGSFGVVATF